MSFENIHLPKNRIAEFCQRWQVTELAVFGSVLREDFRPGSDIDIIESVKPVIAEMNEEDVE